MTLMCGSGRTLLQHGCQARCRHLTCCCFLHSCEVQSGSSPENEASPTLMYNVEERKPFHKFGIRLLLDSVQLFRHSLILIFFLCTFFCYLAVQASRFYLVAVVGFSPRLEGEIGMKIWQTSLITTVLFLVRTQPTSQVPECRPCPLTPPLPLHTPRGAVISWLVYAPVASLNCTPPVLSLLAVLGTEMATCYRIPATSVTSMAYHYWES